MSPASYRAAPPRVVCLLLYWVVAAGCKSGGLVVSGVTLKWLRATSDVVSEMARVRFRLGQPPPCPGVGEDGGVLGGGGEDGCVEGTAALAWSYFLSAASRS